MRAGRGPWIAVVLVAASCTSPPPEFATGGSEGSTGSPASTTAGSEPGTAATSAAPGEGSSSATSGDTGDTALDTTQGAVDGTGTSTTTGDGSSTGPECTGPEGCTGNEVCTGGRCVDACGGTWGVGGYGYCLDEFGDFDTDTACGPDHLCVYWGNPIEQTACTRQGCAGPCDCPPPPDTGTATVTCGQITADPGEQDCYLSCANDEACPTGMTCRASGVCTNEVPPEVPLYGDCGNLAAPCEAPGFCLALPGGATVCAQTCMVPGDCAAPVPAGGAAPFGCSNVADSVFGTECYLSCIDGMACPDGMTCVNGTLCAWPG